MTDLYSRPYEPNPDRCCEACVFGRGEHAAWCTSTPAESPELAEDLIDTVITAAV